MALKRDEPLLEVPTVPAHARQQVVDAELSVEYADNIFGDVKLRHRSYNGKLVGPTIRVRPGNTLHVRLENHLPQEAGPGAHGADTPHGFNTTNLHTHGLHVSPVGESDNVFLSIHPGETFDYRLEIPPDHPTGTFWYHAHTHGSVDLQLTSGMAGALIVEGGLDNAPELQGIKEQIMVFEQFVYRPLYYPPLPAPDLTFHFPLELTGGGSSRNSAARFVILHRPAEILPEDVYGPRSAAAVAVTAMNGMVTPTIRMHPGEVQRWRMIHAGVDASLNLHLEDQANTEKHPLYEIASDGLASGKIVPRDVLELQPGYRSDVLVRAGDHPDIYLLRTEVTDPTRALNGKMMPSTYVVKVVVAGDPQPMTLPSGEALAKYRAFAPLDPAKVVKRRELTFRHDGNRFDIDGKVFDPTRTDQILQLNDVEEWTITSTKDAHPFHIHVNPFEVLTTDPQTGITEGVWRDTVFVPEHASVKFLTQFTQFTGKTVIHCHNLEHEDHGMMQRIEIVNPGEAPPAAPQGGFAALPRPAPAWQLPDPFGGSVDAAAFKGRKLLLVFHQGINCIHCATQIRMLAQESQKLRERGVDIAAIAPVPVSVDNAREFRAVYGIDFPLLCDAGLNAFRDYGCLRDQAPLHGTFLIDEQGIVRWQSTGSQPEMDLEKIIAEISRLPDAAPKPITRGSASLY